MLFERGGSLRSSVSNLWERILSRGQPRIFFTPKCFLLPQEAVFLSACVNNHVSLCLCTWSTWEQTPVVLQMSSCLIINPIFHAHLNFIITDTCICSACTCMCMRMHIHSFNSPCAPLSPNCLSWRAVASKTTVSYLTLPPSSFSRFLASVTSHIFFLFCSFPCASFSLFPNQSLSHLCLSLLYLPGRFPSKEKWCFCFIFISHFCGVRFL